MTLGFPNPNRSFDPKRFRIQFWGYDSAIEITFFLEAGALRKLSPAFGGAEPEFLRAFDAARERIHEVAVKIYKSGAKGSYTFVLTEKDF